MHTRDIAISLLVALSGSYTTGHASEHPTCFDAAVVVADEFNRFEYILDLNDDGFMDTFSMWPKDTGYDEYILNGWYNDQSGRLNQQWSIEHAIGFGQYNDPRGSAVGNFDGDGLDDFAIYVKGNVWVYRSTGDAAPQIYATLNTSHWPDGMIAADFNNDGLDDLAIFDNDIHLYNNRGNGAFVFSDSVDVISAVAKNMTLTEANGDGLPDLMTVRGTLIDLYYVVDGKHVGTNSVVHDLGSNDDTMATSGDIDNDGDEDVVVFHAGDYSVLRRTDATTFVAEPTEIGGPATGLADVDMDGDLDGVCCGGGGDGKTRNVWESQYEISINDGSGAFTPSTKITAIGAHHLAGVADMDNDGDADLVAGRTVYYNQGGITAQTHSSVSEASIKRSMINDYDNDGDPDLGFGIDSASRNLADGTIDTIDPISPAAPAGQHWSGPGFPGDFDGDGDTDLLVSLESGVWFAPNFHGMHLFSNNGGGVLYNHGLAADETLDMSKGGATFGDDPRGSFSADADGDGDIDLFTHYLSGGTSTLYWNDGTGFFTEGPEFSGERIQDVTDLNGDGVPDLVLSDDLPVIRLGVGDGTFEPGFTLPSLMNSTDILGIGDIDNDGDQDIAVVNTSTRWLYFHYNDGSANFTTVTNELLPYKVHFNTTSFGTHVTDINNDGLVDVMYWPVEYANNSTYVVLRKADNSGWQTPLIQTFLPTALEDVDGDGDLDALDTKIYENLTHTLPASGMRKQYGQGSALTCAGEPVLGASGPFRAGELASLQITGIESGQIGLVAVSYTPSDINDYPVVGTTALNWPWSFWFWLPASAGDSEMPGGGTASFNYVVGSGWSVLGDVYHQAYFFDSCAPGGAVSTNALILNYQD